jgi:predicted DNA binding CopG/RHH family protein
MTDKRGKMVIQLRLTPEEYEELKRQARAKGLKYASYLRMLIYEKGKEGLK